MTDEVILESSETQKKKRKPRGKTLGAADALLQGESNDLDIEVEQVAEDIKNTTKLKVIQKDKILSELVEKVLLYCQKQADTDLYEYQKEFGRRLIESLITNDGDEITALFSRQSGKTETVATVIAGCMILLPILAKIMPDQYALEMYKKGVMIGIFAPSKEQAFTTFSRTKERLVSKHAKMFLTDPDIAADFETEKGNPIVVGGVYTDNEGKIVEWRSLLRMQTAAKQSQIESKSYHMVVIEEAQDCDNTKILKSIHPMIAAYNGTICKIGTANTKKSNFYDAIRRNIRNEQNAKSKRNHFQFDYKTAAKYNPRYAKSVEKEIERMGYDSDEFRMAFRLHFILERGMFMTQEQLEEDVLDTRLGYITEDKKSHCVAGIDFAKGGDSTVVTILGCDFENGEKDPETGDVKPFKTLLNWLEFNGEDYEDQFWQIVEFLRNYNVVSMHVDSTGVGDPIADRFINYYMGQIDVTGYKFSRQSKSHMWKTLNQEILARRIRVPSNARTQRLRPYKKFCAQMLDLEKDYVGQYMVCQHPDEKNAHDDFCDSLALAVLAATEGILPEVEASNNPWYANHRTESGYRRWG
jgi:hypothetical protein